VVEEGGARPGLRRGRPDGAGVTQEDVRNVRNVWNVEREDEKLTKYGSSNYCCLADYPRPVLD
jgi:hypothetical protein